MTGGRILRRSGAVLVATLSLAAVASAHGGVFPPPPPAPTMNPNPTVTGAPGRPATGATPPVTGRVPGATTGSRGPVTGGRSRAPGYEAWEIWWEFNKEPYLPRHTAAGKTALSTSPGFHTGRGIPAEPADVEEAVRFLMEEVRASILPVLASALTDPVSDVVDSAAIALGRSTGGAATGAVLPLLVRTLTHPERSPQEAAILGLGILGDPAAAALLVEVATDTAEGRRLVGEAGSIDPLHRSLACLALGLLDAPQSAAPLLSLAADRTLPRELTSACVAALGLMKSNAPTIVVELGKLLEDERLDRETRAQVPIALLRLPAESSRAHLGRLVDLLGSPRAPDDVRRSAAIALGRLGTADEAPVVEALRRALRGDPDAMVRSFACIALGRLGEHGAPAAASEALRKAYQDIHFELLSALRLGRDSLRPFAALAVALFARGEATRDLPGGASTLAALTAAKLAETLAEESNAGFRGALALALGLVGAPEGIAALQELLRETRDPALQAHAALALALSGDTTSIPELRRRVLQKGLSPAHRLSLARALGMLEDVDFGDDLVAMLQEAGDLGEASAAAKALGLLGDRRATQPLVEIATNAQAQNLRRAFAVVALGLLGEKTPLPWNTVYSVDANYTLPNRALVEVASIL